jgi:hypothetical protein
MEKIGKYFSNKTWPETMLLHPEVLERMELRERRRKKAREIEQSDHVLRQ